MGGFYWIASYPKSGNTWMRLLLASLRAGGSAPSFDARIGFAPVTSHFADAEAILDVEPTDLTPDELAELRHDMAMLVAREAREPQFRKVHDAWGLTPSGRPLFPPQVTLGSLYLVRDPRDIALSWAHFSGRTVDETIGFLAKPSQLSKLPPRVSQTVQQLSTWSGHVLSWLEAEPRPLVVRYEDMLADPADALTKAARHLGLDTDPETVVRAVAATRFDRLQAEEEEKGFEMGQIKGRNFFRRGEAGGWRDVLTPEQAERIVSDHGEAMERLGYLQAPAKGGMSC